MLPNELPVPERLGTSGRLSIHDTMKTGMNIAKVWFVERGPVEVSWRRNNHLLQKLRFGGPFRHDLEELTGKKRLRRAGLCLYTGNSKFLDLKE